MARIRALDTIETSWQLPEKDWHPDPRDPTRTVRSAQKTIKAGEEAEVPDDTAASLVKLGLAEVVKAPKG